MHAGCRIEQVYLCRAPVDFRKSIGGLSVLVEQELELSPFASALYVFINRQRDKIKVLYWHRNGFCLWLKRLKTDKFAWPSGGAIRRRKRSACKSSNGCSKASIYGAINPTKPCILLLFHRGIW